MHASGCSLLPMKETLSIIILIFLLNILPFKRVLNLLVHLTYALLYESYILLCATEL